MRPETIYAPATPPGIGGVAVIRISGAHAQAALAQLTRKPAPPPRLACLRKLYDPQSGALLDEALCLSFTAPHSYTGEDVVELHLHGGRAVLQNILAALGTLAHLAPAGPGDFTRRAFENGRMDLTQAEAVNDLIQAETSLQADAALRQMGGVLSHLYEGWRTELMHLLAHIEAEMEFPDEDLPLDLQASFAPQFTALCDEMAAHLDDHRRGERLREGFHIAILGAPNAGKSALLNRLAQREAAIVSSIAGTTRDVIELHLDLGGYPVILADTAGLRETADAIEDEGIRRARQKAAEADLCIALFDVTAAPQWDAETLALLDERSLAVANKCDLLPAPPEALEIRGHKASLISAETGAGITDFLEQLVQTIATRYAPRNSATLTRARHRQALSATLEALIRAQSAPLPELIAEDTRLALRHLGSITGRVDIEDLLDITFRDFCIGK